MGYFSQAAIDAEDREDRSYPSPGQQLEWRLEDLRDRLEEVGQGSLVGRSRYTGADLEYTLPEHLDSAEAILAAIAIVSDKLERLSVTAEEQTEEPAIPRAKATLTKAA